MNSYLSKLVLALGIAITLGACATAPSSSADDRYAQIHAGLTQDEVRAIAGAPEFTGSNRRMHETLWTYSSTDTWGESYEFGVDFDDATGLVTETSRLRTDY